MFRSSFHICCSFSFLELICMQSNYRKSQERVIIQCSAETRIYLQVRREDRKFLNLWSWFDHHLNISKAGFGSGAPAGNSTSSMHWCQVYAWAHPIHFAFFLKQTAGLELGSVKGRVEKHLEWEKGLILLLQKLSSDVKSILISVLVVMLIIITNGRGSSKMMWILTSMSGPIHSGDAGCFQPELFYDSMILLTCLPGPKEHRSGAGDEGNGNQNTLAPPESRGWWDQGIQQHSW